MISFSQTAQIMEISFDGSYLTVSSGVPNVLVALFTGPLTSCRTVKIYENNIYVVDNVQRRIKKFSIKGESLGNFNVLFNSTVIIFFLHFLLYFLIFIFNKIFDVSWNKNINATLIYVSMDSGGLGEYKWPSGDFSKWIIRPDNNLSPVGTVVNTISGEIYGKKIKIKKYFSFSFFHFLIFLIN